jgi:exopolysaccharide biosynthesis predicted pyruvyltransferase EpsI
MRRLKVASYSVGTCNLGDHIQIIAQLNLLKKHGVVPSIYFDRDFGDFGQGGCLDRYENDVLLVMNGWHKVGNQGWPPSDKLVPIITGFHIRPHRWKNATSKENLKYLETHSSIGCRDEFTKNLLESHGIECHLSNCLTTTFEKRESSEAQTQTYVVSAESDWFDILPSYIRNECEYINHYTKTTDFSSNMIDAEMLLSKYRKSAKLVITTLLHCALPCIAMGIPVVVFYPNSQEKPMNTDVQRMSTLSKLVKCHSFKDHASVNWNPSTVSIEDTKCELKLSFDKKLTFILEKYDEIV